MESVTWHKALELMYSPTVGKYSLHDYTSNDNGLRVVDFAIWRNLAVSSTYFGHKNIHKVWQPEYRQMEDQKTKLNMFWLIDATDQMLWMLKVAADLEVLTPVATAGKYQFCRSPPVL